MSKVSHYDLAQLVAALSQHLSALEGDGLTAAINAIKRVLASQSPFKAQPVESVQWLHYSALTPNDYNPNKMAPAELRLLELSIQENGFTQPIVVQRTEAGFIIIDGYHRYSLVQKSTSLAQRPQGYVPVVVLEQAERAALIAATVRHNRAKGSHQIGLMSSLVKELSLLGLSKQEIGVKLGMDEDEVLRLKQITGLCELFSEVAFSPAWTVT